MSPSFDRLVEEVRRGVEAELERLLGPVEEAGDLAPLHAAMRHAVLGGGKRVRALLVDLAGRALDVPEPARRRVGAAVELLHAYSLVHDDLPAMDDASLRRGLPTVHRRFGEDVAILAGDALQALAFEVLARDDWPASAPARAALVAELAAAAGWRGMCGGQFLDLHPAGSDEAEVVHLQRLKTGALIAFCVRAPAILAQAPAPVREALERYADALGLAFQITDDLLDVEGTAATTGKDTGRDVPAGKATLVALFGVEGARRRLRDLAREAEEALALVPADATWLRELFRRVCERTS